MKKTIFLIIFSLFLTISCFSEVITIDIKQGNKTVSQKLNIPDNKDELRQYYIELATMYKELSYLYDEQEKDLNNALNKLDLIFDKFDKFDILYTSLENTNNDIIDILNKKEIFQHFISLGYDFNLPEITTNFSVNYDLIVYEKFILGCGLGFLNKFSIKGGIKF